MSQEAREAARRIVAEVLAAQQGGDPGTAGQDAALPAAATVDVADRTDQRPTALRARALVAAVFDPPAATPVAGPASASEPEPDPEPGPAPAAPTAAQRRARELVEEAAAAQAARERRSLEAPATPSVHEERTGPVQPAPAPGVAHATLFAAPEPEQPAEDRLFARSDVEEELLPEQQDLPPSLAEDVEGPPPPPPPAPPALRAEPPAVVDPPAPSLPAAQVAEPPRADLAARLVSEVLEERGRSEARSAPAPPAAAEDQVTQQLLEEQPRGAARWLLVTAIGAITLALLLPLAVAAVRELLALS